MNEKVLLLGAVILITACGSPSADNAANYEEESTTQSTTVTEPELPAVEAPAGSALKVYVAPDTDPFDDATISLASMVHEPGSNSAMFSFDVQNYELGMQTGDAPDRGCANSAKGQHIHFILNNAPYKAHYEAEFSEEVNDGNNVLLAFLSRSYHESVKGSQAAIVTSFQSGDDTGGPQIDPSKDMTLFYSRPKGSYKSSDGNKILLDFYLLNCQLDRSGHKVKSTINGEDFILNEWKAYFVEGLGVGTHTVRLQLLDENNELIPGPFNDSGNREFTITAD